MNVFSRPSDFTTSSILITFALASLMIDFFIWKYSVYHSRNIDLDCFFKEYDFWKESILNHLYPSHASEINIMYDYLISNHQHLKIKALKK